MKITVDVKEKGMSSAFEKRINLLEKMLIELKKSDRRGMDSFMKVIQKNQEKDSKTISNLVGSMKTAFSKIKQPTVKTVKVTKPDNTALVKAISSRTLLLEKLIREKKKKDKIVVQVKQEPNITNLVTNVSRGARVMPSPS